MQRSGTAVTHLQQHALVALRLQLCLQAGDALTLGLQLGQHILRAAGGVGWGGVGWAAGTGGRCRRAAGGRCRRGRWGGGGTARAAGGRRRRVEWAGGSGGAMQLGVVRPNAVRGMQGSRSALVQSCWWTLPRAAPDTLHLPRSPEPLPWRSPHAAPRPAARLPPAAAAGWPPAMHEGVPQGARQGGGRRAGGPGRQHSLAAICGNG